MGPEFRVALVVALILACGTEHKPHDQGTGSSTPAQLEVRPPAVQLARTCCGPQSPVA